MANVTVKLEAPSKTKMINDIVSVQPMTSLNEQCLAILFDAIVLKIMDKIGENHESMWKRHSNLE